MADPWVEIELTDELIAASVEEFYAVDLRFESAESDLVEIFRAMLLRQTFVRERPTR